MKKQSGLKNEQKVQKILVSGSAVLPQKNSAGVRVAKKRKPMPDSPIVKGYPDLSDIPTDSYGNLSEAGKINTNDLDGGIVSGKLVRAKYDNAQIKKSIDTNIFELIPQIPIELPDTVLRSVYNTVTQSVNDLTLEVQSLTTEVSTLNSTISELEIVNESLKIEADNERLKANIAEQQSTTANEQVATTTIDLSNAIQNSINEAIQRVSLTARNESLLQENTSLREQLFGLAAQTAEGAISGGDNNFTVKVNGNKGDAEQQSADIFIRTSAEQGNNRIMGVSLEVSNVTTDKTITSINFDVTDNKWFTVSGPSTIDSESSEVYELKYNNFVINTLEPYKKKNWLGISYWKGSATNYSDSKLKVTVKFSDGSTDNVILSTDLRKNRKG